MCQFFFQRVNAHRKSRVASTPDVTTPRTIIVPDPTPRPISKSMLKSMDDDFDPSRMLDTLANPQLSIHLQARHSLDESSTDLETGIHTAWRSSAWSKKLHGAALFTINEEEGELEIPTDGLYLVYAQVSTYGFKL